MDRQEVAQGTKMIVLEAANKWAEYLERLATDADNDDHDEYNAAALNYEALRIKRAVREESK